jgi:hypothetical protein
MEHVSHDKVELVFVDSSVAYASLGSRRCVT